MCSLAPDYLDPTTEELNGKKEFKLTEYEKSPPQIKVTLGLVSFLHLFRPRMFSLTEATQRSFTLVQ